MLTHCTASNPSHEVCMQQADMAGSTRAGASSSGNSTSLSSTRRSVLAAAFAMPIAASLIASSWSERFDPKTWIERWIRAGHAIVFDTTGHPLIVQRMDGDEDHATVMRGELGYYDNRHRLLSYLANRRAMA